MHPVSRTIKEVIPFMRTFIKYGLLVLMLAAPLTSFAADTLKLRYINYAAMDSKGVALKLPEGVACSDTELIVADTENDRLVRYSYQEKNLKGGDEIKVSQIAFPVRLQLNSKGEIFVLDGRTHIVVRLSSDGAFIGNVDPQGVSAPANFVIKSFKIDTNDNIYLVDIFGERVLKLDPAGKLISQIPFPKGFGFMTDVAVTLGGDILLLDSVKSIVYVSKKDSPAFVPFTKEMSGYMNFASYIVTNSSSADIYLLDEDGGAVVVVGPDGSFKGRQLSLGWKPGLLYYPTQMCMNKKGDVFIADRNNSRVQIFENVK
jgi:hypothetical protein